MGVSDSTIEAVGGEVVAAEVVVPCAAIDETLEFLTERLGFRLDVLMPADDPATAVVSGHGLRLRLQRDAPGDPPALLIRCTDPDLVAGGTTDFVAPNGSRVTLVASEPPLAVPSLRAELVISRAGDRPHAEGRAGMRYRDLIPDRQGGRFIASHIVVAEGGPVPDYVHHHRVRFQMIHCVRGTVRVVYEDQGPPFELAPGDCVLQPPGIRHRVLASSAGAEVVEIGCPAEHETYVDHDLRLPTRAERPDRDFGGQRFVHHRAAGAPWIPWRGTGFECRESGIAGASDGLAGSRVIRPATAGRAELGTHDAELVFWFVVDGALTLEFDPARRTERLGATDAVTIPAGLEHRIAAASADLQLLEVTLPASVQ